MAPGRGLEPLFSAPKALVLPLDEPGKPLEILGSRRLIPKLCLDNFGVATKGCCYGSLI